MTFDKSINNGKLLKPLWQTVEALSSAFDTIPDFRRKLLLTLTEVIVRGLKHQAELNLNFICTHNSRRSHMAQLWAQAAAHYYGIKGIKCFSGGTEATAFNSRAVAAMKRVGFEIQEDSESANPTYSVRYSEEATPVTAFSKRYDDPFNPRTNFVAIMTCSHADEHCPLVPGASERIAITYDDPKEFDGTGNEKLKYDERALEIGRDMLFAFSEAARVARKP